METKPLRVAFLVGGDTPSTRLAIEEVCRLPRVDSVAILLDVAPSTFRSRLKNLRKNIRVNGWRYPGARLLQVLMGLTSRLVSRVGPSTADVRRVLEECFPDRHFSLETLARKYGMSVLSVPNLNSPASVQMLADCNVDLGIVIGTRVLKQQTFAVPRLGCINLHKGKVPEYRGMPPGFWEIYDGASSCGVTVHFVDKGLDTGDIVATSSIAILGMETPDTLMQKLHLEGARVLAAAVASIRDGCAHRQKQEGNGKKPRTKPTRAELTSLRRRLPHWKQPSDLSVVIRNLYLLIVYYSGLYWLVRQLHRSGRSRAAIFLYHRVNDYAWDVLTVDTATFAAQLIAISKRYPTTQTSILVDRLVSGQPIEPTTVAIHFDDCYREVLTNGAPILKKLGIPACAFINSGYIGTSRSFAHDVAKYPFTFAMLSAGEVVELISKGFEVGAHTVNHVDLGRVDEKTARYEVETCGEELRKIAQTGIDLFSFPFGRVDNISAVTRNVIVHAGYRALFSAHGGFLTDKTDKFDIPRSGVSWEASPLYCLLQIEGLTPAQLAGAFRSMVSGSGKKSPKPATAL